MTVEQLAVQLNVTRQAIMNKLRREGISCAELSSGKQGKAWILTDEGADKIRDLMRGKTWQKVNESQADNIESMRNRIKEQQSKIEALTQAIEEQNLKNEELKEEIDKQKADIENLNKTIQAQAITAAAQAATIQSMQQAAVQRLEAHTENRTVGKWARFIARLKGETPKKAKGPEAVVVEAEKKPAQDPGKAAGDVTEDK